MGRKIAVAGIGTEVGKTIASAIVCKALSADYWKPIQAGDLEASDSLTVRNLAPKTTIHPETFRLNTPMAPHESARKDGVSMNASDLTLPKTENNLVVEMAGGLMVPLNENELFVDFIQQNRLEVVLVSSYYLGSINHTILSLEALKQREIPVKGIIFNGEKVKSTFEIVQKFYSVKVLLEIAKEPLFTPELVNDYALKLSQNWN